MTDLRISCDMNEKKASEAKETAEKVCSVIKKTGCKINYPSTLLDLEVSVLCCFIKVWNKFIAAKKL